MLLCFGLGQFAGAATVSITPSKDNTLIDVNTGGIDPQRSDGGGNSFFVGTTGQLGADSIRRGVMAFNVAGSVPVGATITRVQLRLNMTKANNSTARSISLHKALSDWAEGSLVGPSGGGAGLPATQGSVTWIYSNFNTVSWNTPGGDFVTANSGVQNVGGNAAYTWDSNVSGNNGMVADVQSWLNSPSNNFGWILLGNEVSQRTAKRFDSREASNVNNRPTLTITYTPIPEPASMVLGCAGAAFLRRRRAAHLA